MPHKFYLHKLLPLKNPPQWAGKRSRADTLKFNKLHCITAKMLIFLILLLSFIPSLFLPHSKNVSREGSGHSSGCFGRFTLHIRSSYI